MAVRSHLVRFTVAAVASAVLACGGGSSPSTPVQPTPPPVPTTPAVTLSSIVVGVAGNAPAAIAPGDRLQLFAQAVYSDDSRADVTNTALWQSSNPIVATVSSGGVLTGAAEGSLDVNATYLGRSGSLHADVQKPGCLVTLSPPSLSFSAFGASATVQVTTSDSTCRWTAKSDASWLPFSYDPNRSGNGAFSYTVPGNSTTQPRTGNIVVSVVGAPSVSHVVQQERPLGCSYVVTPDHITFPGSGGTGAFDLVTTPGDCQWTVTNNGSYLGVRLTGPASGTGNAHLTYTVPSNPYSSDMSTTIEVRGLSGLNPPGVHTVTIVKK